MAYLRKNAIKMCHLGVSAVMALFVIIFMPSASDKVGEGHCVFGCRIVRKMLTGFAFVLHRSDFFSPDALILVQNS